MSTNELQEIAVGNWIEETLEVERDDTLHQQTLELVLKHGARKGIQELLKVREFKPLKSRKTYLQKTLREACEGAEVIPQMLRMQPSGRESLYRQHH